MKKIISGFFLACCIGIRLTGQSCPDLLKRFDAQYNTAGYPALEALVQQVLIACAPADGRPDSFFLRARYDLGLLYEREHRWQKADSVHRATLRLLNLQTSEQYPILEDIYNSLGVISAYLGKPDSAVVYYQKALEIIGRAKGKGSDYCAVWNNLGDVYWRQGLREKAFLHFQAGIRLMDSLSLGHNETYANMHVYAGGLLREMGREKEGLLYNIKAVMLYDTIVGKKHRRYAYALGQLAQAYRANNQYFQAVQSAEEGIKISDETEGADHPDHAMKLSFLAVLSSEMGRYNKALELQLKALEIQQKNGNNYWSFGSLLGGVGDAYHNLGKYDLALDYYLQAFAASDTTIGRAHPNFIPRLYQLAFAYLSLGMPDRALPLYEEALWRTEKVYGKQHPFYRMRLSNLGYYYDYIGDYDNMSRYCELAVQYSWSMQDTANMRHAIRLNNLAVGYINLEQYEKALSYMEATVRLSRQVLDNTNPDLGIRINSLAELYTKLGRFREAEQYFTESLDNARQYLGWQVPGYGISFANAAAFYETVHRPEKALELFREANTSFLAQAKVSFGALSEFEKNAFFETLRKRFEEVHSFAWRHRRMAPEMAGILYDNALILKGQLLASTKEVFETARQSKNPEQSAVYERWLDTRQMLAHLYTLPASKRFASPDSLEQVSNDLERQLAQHSRSFDAAVRDIHWQDVAAVLDSAEVVVEFVHFRYYRNRFTDSVLYCALVYRPGFAQPKLVPLFEQKQLERRFGQKFLRTRDFVRNLYDNELYSLIWQPMDSLLDGARTVYYAPSGLLHRIAFPAIPAGTGTLADRYRLEYVSSTRNLALRQPDTGSFQTALLYGGLVYQTDTSETLLSTPGNAGGNRAPGEYVLRGLPADSTRSAWGPLDTTLVEVNRLECLFKANRVFTMTLRESEGTEESFKAIGEKFAAPDILHVATHGFFFPDPGNQPGSEWEGGRDHFRFAGNPLLRSGLILAGADDAWVYGKSLPNREDGILTAFEIARQNLSGVRLVVLSACETGLGDIRGSEGVYGLQRAFKMAGAQYLLLTLWKIPDGAQTVEFMTTFYEKCLSGLPVRQAFGETQAAIREKYVDPYYWAGFVLVD